MTIALTIWNERIAPLFDSAATCLIFRKHGPSIDVLQSLALLDGTLQDRVSALSSRSVDALICGALSCEARQLLCIHNIEIYAFVTGEIESVLQGLRSGELTSQRFSMPGCGCPRHWGRTRHGFRFRGQAHDTKE